MLKIFLPLIIAAGLATANLPDGGKSYAKIDKGLRETLEVYRTANVLITFFEGTKDVLDAIEDTRFPSREDRLWALGDALQEFAKEEQKNVVDFIGQFRNLEWETLWITNQLYIKDVDLSIVEAIVEFQEVELVMEDFNIDLENSNPEIIDRDEDSEPLWNMQLIQAQEAQALLDSGSGGNVHEIRVGTIDTGARHTHETLRDNYVGDWGWFDPYDRTTEPNDNVGHGTHVLGSLCGSTGIGVYPSAKWMSCKGCATMKCSFVNLLMCGQFMTCPNSPDGTMRNCSLAPHVVSNSWGTGMQGLNLYDGVIAAWHVAQIIPVFSLGNSGPYCSRAYSPGDRAVIGVGSTTVNDTISSFSARGPSALGQLKPEIVAPGTQVISAYHLGDDSYASMSGTSMATPTTAGLIAMLRALDPDNILYQDIRKHLFAGAKKTGLGEDGGQCGGIPSNVFPNNIYGHGRINAFNSMKSLLNIN